MIQPRRSRAGKSLQMIRKLLTTALMDNYLIPSLRGDDPVLEGTSILAGTGLLREGENTRGKVPFLVEKDGSMSIHEDFLYDLSDMYIDDMVVLGFAQWDDADDPLWLAPSWLWPFIKPGSVVDSLNGNPIEVPVDYQYGGQDSLEADRRFGLMAWGVKQSRLSTPD